MNAHEDLSTRRPPSLSEVISDTMLAAKERLLSSSAFRGLEPESRHALIELGVLERIPRRTRVAHDMFSWAMTGSPWKPFSCTVA